MSVTNIQNVIGKKQSMEVSETVVLHIEVLNDKEVRCQFIDEEDGVKDPAFISPIQIVHDDIDGVDDYSFTDSIGASRFFLFQFDPTVE